MSDIVKDDTQTPPSLKHQIEDVLRATQTLNGLRIEGLNHKVTAFTRAPLLLEEALAEIKALEQRHADALDALNRMTDQRDEALGGQPSIELPQHRLRVAIQEAAEYNEMIPLHTDDPHALHFQQMVKRWLDGKGMHPQQVDRIGQLVTQLKDATAQCGAMADLLREAKTNVDQVRRWGRFDHDEGCGAEAALLLTRIDAALDGKLPAPAVTVTETIRTAPERIWLQIGDDEHYSSEPFPSNTESVTWCRDSVTGCEVPYVRADLLNQRAPATPLLDQVRSKLNSRSIHTLMALADILERDEAKGLSLQLDDKTYVATSVLRAMAAELPEAWRMMCGDWQEELVALHGPTGHIVSGLTVAQATALIEAHGGSQVWAMAAVSTGGAA